MTLLFLIASCNPVSAQVEPPQIGSLSKKDIWKYTGFSAAMVGVYSAEIAASKDLDFGNDQTPWWFYPTVGLQHLPLYALDSQKGLRFTGAELGIFLMHRMSVKNRYLNNKTLALYLDAAFYSTYVLYGEARKYARAGLYDEPLKTFSTGDLILAPFQKENLTHPLFIKSMFSAGLITSLYVLADNDASWRSGKERIKSGEVSRSLGRAGVYTVNILKQTATAVSEEALFRGVIYEEMKAAWGANRAKVIDMILFPLLHVPQDLDNNAPSDEILGAFLVRSASTLVFDLAYDWKGLPLSIALHMWGNVIGSTVKIASQKRHTHPNSGNGFPPNAPFMIRYSIRL